MDLYDDYRNTLTWIRWVAQGYDHAPPDGLWRRRTALAALTCGPGIKTCPALHLWHSLVFLSSPLFRLSASQAILLQKE